MSTDRRTTSIRPGFDSLCTMDPFVRKGLPLAVYTAEQVRALDRHAIDDLGIPSYTLMTRAGEAALRTLRSCWPSTQNVVVVCGPGNNAGDGYVLARAAREQRLNMRVLALGDPAKLRGD